MIHFAEVKGYVVMVITAEEHWLDRGEYARMDGHSPEITGNHSSIE
jgi:hypothetical protein